MNDTGRIITSKMVYFDESSKQTLSRAERAFDERYDIESYRESWHEHGRMRQYGYAYVYPYWEGAPPVQIGIGKPREARPCALDGLPSH